MSTVDFMNNLATRIVPSQASLQKYTQSKTGGIINRARRSTSRSASRRSRTNPMQYRFENDESGITLHVSPDENYTPKHINKYKNKLESWLKQKLGSFIISSLFAKTTDGLSRIYDNTVKEIKNKTKNLVNSPEELSSQLIPLLETYYNLFEKKYEKKYQNIQRNKIQIQKNSAKSIQGKSRSKIRTLETWINKQRIYLTSIYKGLNAFSKNPFLSRYNYEKLPHFAKLLVKNPNVFCLLLRTNVGYNTNYYEQNKYEVEKRVKTSVKTSIKFRNKNFNINLTSSIPDFHYRNFCFNRMLDVLNNAPSSSGVSGYMYRGLLMPRRFRPLSGLNLNMKDITSWTLRPLIAVSFPIWQANNRKMRANTTDEFCYVLLKLKLDTDVGKLFVGNLSRLFSESVHRLTQRREEGEVIVAPLDLEIINQYQCKLSEFTGIYVNDYSRKQSYKGMESMLDTVFHDIRKRDQLQRELDKFITVVTVQKKSVKVSKKVSKEVSKKSVKVSKS